MAKEKGTKVQFSNTFVALDNEEIRNKDNELSQKKLKKLVLQGLD